MGTSRASKRWLLSAFGLILKLPQRSDRASEPYTNVLTASRAPPAQKWTVLSDGDVSSGRLRVRLLRSARREPCGCCQDGPLGEPAGSRVGCLSPLSALSPSAESRVTQLASLAQERRNEDPATMMRTNPALVLNTPGATGAIDHTTITPSTAARARRSIYALAVPLMSAPARSSVITRSTKSNARSIR